MYVCGYDLQYDRSVMDLSCCGFIYIYDLRYYYNACVPLVIFKWGSIGYPLGIVQWDFTKRDHLGDLGRVRGSGPVMMSNPTWFGC